MSLIPPESGLGGLLDPTEEQRAEYQAISDRVGQLIKEIAATEVTGPAELVDAAIASKYLHHHIEGDVIGDTVAQLQAWVLAAAHIEPSLCDPTNPAFEHPNAREYWASKREQWDRENAAAEEFAGTVEGKQQARRERLADLKRKVEACEEELQAIS